MYTVCSRGNCYASVGEYEKALDDFKRSAEVFRKISNANGYVYAASNAALTYAQLGDDDLAIKVCECVCGQYYQPCQPMTALHLSRASHVPLPR